MRPLRVLSCLLGALAAGGAFASAVTLPDAERIVLDNGAVLILSENHEVPLVGLEAIVRGGAASDPEGQHGLANLLAGLLEKGAGDRDATAFAEAVDAVGGRLTAAAGVEAISISADFMSKDAALMVELVADMLRRPKLDAREFRKLRDRSINLIKAAKGYDPSGLMPSYANAFLFAEHPYGNPRGGSEASLAKISHSALRSYYTNTFGADRLIISVAGDFDSGEMREALSAAFTEWAPARDALPEIEIPSRAAGGQVFLIDKPGATQTYFYIGNVGVARDFAARADLDIANTLFGGRFTSMLMTELRTKSGLSYRASSVLTRNRRSGSMFIRSFTETGTTVEALDVALATLAQLHETGPDEAAVSSAQNYIMGQFPTSLETAAQVAGVFAMLEAYDLGVSYINDYGEALAAATPVSVAAVIDAVYPPVDQLVFVLLGDAEKIRESIARYGEVAETSISEPRFHP